MTANNEVPMCMVSLQTKIQVLPFQNLSSLHNFAWLNIKLYFTSFEDKKSIAVKSNIMFYFIIHSCLLRLHNENHDIRALMPELPIIPIIYRLLLFR